jgi:hypothetical protein
VFAWLLRDFARGWRREGIRRREQRHCARLQGAALRAEVVHYRKLIARAGPLIEGLQAQIAELEVSGGAAAERQCAELLRQPGVRAALLHAFHTDKHPNATPGELHQLNETMRLILTTYRALEGKR